MKIRKSSKKSQGKGLNKVYSFKSKLQNITKSSKGTRKEAVRKVWKHINQNNLKGNKTETLRHKGKTYKGGQVILCKNKAMKEFSMNKNKIAMTEIGGLISKHLV